MNTDSERECLDAFEGLLLRMIRDKIKLLAPATSVVSLSRRLLTLTDSIGRSTDSSSLPSSGSSSPSSAYNSGTRHMAQMQAHARTLEKVLEAFLEMALRRGSLFQVLQVVKELLKLPASLGGFSESELARSNLGEDDSGRLSSSERQQRESAGSLQLRLGVMPLLRHLQSATSPGSVADTVPHPGAVLHQWRHHKISQSE
jgi:hypothetical protein